MGKVRKVKYFTNEKKALISDENKKLYEKYLKSSIIKNKDVKETTYKVYQNYMDHFLVYLAEEWDNISLYGDEFMEDAVDIMEGFIGFCQETLLNNKKVINTKISTVSSFFLWSLKRGLIDRHPFDKKLERMKGASDEKIKDSYYLTEDQVEQINEGLLDEKKFDFQDRLIWSIALDSANRVGAISKLTVSSLDLENMVFENVREKRGKIVEVAFEDETKKLIEEWLEMRKEMDNLEIDSFFITRYGGNYRSMSYSSLQDRVRKIGKIVGIDDFYFHTIRKTKLNLLYEQTGNIDMVAEWANHESIETSKKHYIKPKSKAQLRREMRELIKKNKEEKKDNQDQ
ncbi:tyrosine-type recombinase/integrase [Metabacillus arenae]|uniref:Site-specific integrase n=1 Tax=Metabacillus arenae TaxID=2771434 RepID=A0A926NJX6_9BACI|nr:site-specific integrase [Metabacillus arenae]MBD1379221.1 site-specific integrase [Metabacillus arenae]